MTQSQFFIVETWVQKKNKQVMSSIYLP